MLMTNIVLVLAFIAMIGIGVYLVTSSGRQGPDMEDASSPTGDDVAKAQQVRISDADSDRRP